jgi:hypothetical protein
VQVGDDTEEFATDPQFEDARLWHALRPEIRSTSLGWTELKELAARQLLRPDDYVWHPTWEAWRAAGDVPGLFPAQSPTVTEVAIAVERLGVADRVRHELREYAIISVYIWLVVNLLKLHERLLDETYHFTMHSQGRALVTALVLGKIVLIAEALQLGGGLSRRLPAIMIVVRSVLFALAIVWFHAVEELALGLWNGQDPSVIIASVSWDVIWRWFLTSMIIMIALLPYFLVKEIERRTGESDLLLLAVGLKQ